MNFALVAAVSTGFHVRVNPTGLGVSPRPVASLRTGTAMLDRRAALSAALFSCVAAVAPASAKIDSENPANNYYFPQAK